MIIPINRDVQSLRKRAEVATPVDAQVVTDLVDTLNAHKENCVGMAANMIGINKRIIVVEMGPLVIPMINPQIIDRSEAYDTEEGCLSLTGQRKTTRYHKITVAYQDQQFNKHEQSFTEFSAQIIQHEVDHCEGIVI